MSDSPWQYLKSDQVLFIIDAAHRVEEDLLLDWLERTRVIAGFEGQVHTVVVPIVEDPENIPSEALSEALGMPAEAMIAPVRVMWRSRLDQLSNKPRIRDLLSGNPRRPGVKRAQRLLNSDPSSATCIVGTPASLADLSERFEQRQTIALVDKSLADYVAGQASLASVSYTHLTLPTTPYV